MITRAQWWALFASEEQVKWFDDFPVGHLPHQEQESHSAQCCLIARTYATSLDFEKVGLVVPDKIIPGLAHMSVGFMCTVREFVRLEEKEKAHRQCGWSVPDDFLSCSMLLTLFPSREI